MRRMGQTLSPDDTAEVMAELDLDGGGTIHVNEFLDKVRQSNNERAADAKRCKQIFAQCDDDGSGDPPTATLPDRLASLGLGCVFTLMALCTAGFLDEGEMAVVATQMGLGAQVKSPHNIHPTSCSTFAAPQR